MSSAALASGRSSEPLRSDPIVGIDLGTTNSLVAYCFPSGPRVLGGGADGAIVPSVVRFLASGSTVVGVSARRGRLAHPAETVASAKRLIAGSQLPLSAVAARCGFATARHLGEAFRLREGRPPASFRSA
jgi:molecular chaperone DnaK (HSP70)